MTPSQLRKILSYDAKTGIFRWKISPNLRIGIGTVADGPAAKGYRRIVINKRPYQSHRLAWLYVYGKWPTHQIDHINRVKTDNRISNLRDVPDGINKLNMDHSKVRRDRYGKFA